MLRARLFGWAAFQNNRRPYRALEAIAHADLILLGPGSLYTSLLPNLLVPELVTAIQRSRAPRLYICNLMTQPGETDGLDVSGHLRTSRLSWPALGSASVYSQPFSPKKSCPIHP